MLDSSMLCGLARRVLPILVASAFLVPLAVASSPAGSDDGGIQIDPLDHVRTERVAGVSPEG